MTDYTYSFSRGQGQLQTHVPGAGYHPQTQDSTAEQIKALQNEVKFLREEVNKLNEKIYEEDPWKVHI